MIVNKASIFVITLFFMLSSPLIQAMPKITVTHDINQQQFVRIKVKNETRRIIGCYVAIDGFKEKFKLTAFAESRWYKATDRRFKYTDFSVWCDYIEYIK